jgi:hypothetical protein
VSYRSKKVATLHQRDERVGYDLFLASQPRAAPDSSAASHLATSRCARRRRATQGPSPPYPRSLGVGPQPTQRIRWDSAAEPAGSMSGQALSQSQRSTPPGSLSSSFADLPAVGSAMDDGGFDFWLVRLTAVLARHAYVAVIQATVQFSAALVLSDESDEGGREHVGSIAGSGYGRRCAERNTGPTGTRGPIRGQHSGGTDAA